MADASRKLPFACPNCHRDSVHERPPSTTKHDLAGKVVSEFRLGYIVICTTCRRRGHALMKAEQALDSILRRPRFPGDKTKLTTAPTPGQARLHELPSVSWKQGTVRFPPGRRPVSTDIHAKYLKNVSDSPERVVLDIEYGEQQLGRVFVESHKKGLLHRLKLTLEGGIGKPMADTLQWRLRDPGDRPEERTRPRERAGSAAVAERI